MGASGVVADSEGEGSSAVAAASTEEWQGVHVGLESCTGKGHTRHPLHRSHVLVRVEGPVVAEARHEGHPWTT